MRTSAGSPYYFSFHVGDVGHTFICGPSGSGKTVVQNFMLAALEKFGAQQVFIDKDRGAEIFVRACGGTYLTLRNGLTHIRRDLGLVRVRRGESSAVLDDDLVAVAAHPSGVDHHSTGGRDDRGSSGDRQVEALVHAPPPRA